VTPGLALAITVYAGVGLACASYVMGCEHAQPSPPGTEPRAMDLLLIVAAWPLWALMIGVAKALGKDKGDE
jgi:hypothetical protein